MIHYVSLHDVKSIKSFQIVESVSVHKVDGSDLKLHLLRKEHFVEYALALAQDYLGECLRA